MDEDIKKKDDKSKKLVSKSFLDLEASTKKMNLETTSSPKLKSALMRTDWKSNMSPVFNDFIKKMNLETALSPKLKSALTQTYWTHDMLPDLGVDIKKMDLSSQALSNLNSTWTLSPTVLEQISPSLDKEKATKIFRKISEEDYKLSPVYTTKKDKVEKVIEHKKSKKSMPVEEFSESVPLTDVIDSLTGDEVFEFYTHLSEFPLLGLKHRVGKKIFEEIGKVPLQEFKNVCVYRARERNPHQRPAPFGPREMFQAPHGIPENGRFNVTGHGELYTCSSKEVAFKEVKPKDKDNVCDIIGWELVTSIKLLDLSAYDYSPLVQYSSMDVHTNHKQEYLISNFLSQCLKFHKISGIRYKSVIHKEEYNFVFFDFENNWFKRIYSKPNVSSINNL